MKLIPANGIILDLGANIGVTSYHLAKKFPDSTVLSFEPLELNMNTLKRIKRKFKLNNIRVFQVAVGENEGNIEMVMPVIKHVPMHGLSHVVEEGYPDKNEGHKYQVPLVRLDSFRELNNTNKPLTAMKIDVENFEYHVLKGAENLIKKHRPVIYCELWENENRKKCISLLNKLEYSALILYKKELIPIDQATVEKHNFFFVPESITE